MNQYSTRMPTPGASRKRKDRDTFYKPSVVAKSAPEIGAGGEPISCNRLLAGYLAHEFLTKGTLLGQKVDPARAEAVPVRRTAAEGKEWRNEAAPAGESAGTEQESYGEVASIVKTYGTHIPGIVNPTQLSRWIKM